MSSVVSLHRRTRDLKDCRGYLHVFTRRRDDRARALDANRARRAGRVRARIHLIRARTGEGRERAKANGVKMGRKPKLTDHQKREAIKRRDHGEETLAEIGRSYNVSGWTIGTA
jgi:hypothetical protein